MMFDTTMFLLSFDTDYIGWKHQAYAGILHTHGLWRFLIKRSDEIQHLEK